MKKYCDLHTHSSYSDGTCTPAQLIDEAEKIGLSAIALTDHNTTMGLLDFFEAAKGKNVEAIGGVELSTDYGKIELHIVGLFVKEEHFEAIENLVAPMMKRKEESNILLVEGLKLAGYDVDYAEIKAKMKKGHINRAHIASALLEKGYVSSIGEAFDTMLSKAGGYYTQPRRLDVFETITFLKKIGCVSVLAHPFEELDAEGVREFLALAKPFGLDGMETEYAKYSEETVQTAKAIAKEFGIKESGGSDFHGERRKGTYVGVGRGNLRIPMEFADNLRGSL